MRPKHAITVTALAVTAGLALAGCGDNDSTAARSAATATASAEAESGQQSFNDADVAFAKDMVQHHRQAIEMAQLAPDRAKNPDVADLAEDIRAAQDPEIETMTAWLTTWGEPVPEGSGMAEGSGGTAGMDHSGHGGGSGMMTVEDMAALEAARGAEFDQMFLTMMIAHHEGAIVMAEMEQAEGANPDAVALAGTIIDDQEAEIATMQALLIG